MAHAERCPLCSGTGCKDGHDQRDCPTTCHGCGGAGWVSVQDSVPLWIYEPCPPEFRQPVDFQWPPPSFTSDPYGNSRTVVE